MRGGETDSEEGAPGSHVIQDNHSRHRTPQIKKEGFLSPKEHEKGAKGKKKKKQM